MKVVKIDKATCDLWVKAKHYSHRPSIFWAGFALVIDGNVEGVCVFGQPSPSVQKSAFKSRSFRIFELSRLVVQTRRKNAASFLISGALRLLDRPCAVVSYADTRMGHCGIVYQATNWIYTGATVSHDKAYMVDGRSIHSMTLRDRGITSPAKWAKENGIETVKPMPKHRYFYFAGDKSFKDGALGLLKYPVIKEYPKLPKTMYDDGPQIKTNLGWFL